VVGVAAVGQLRPDAFAVVAVFAFAVEELTQFACLVQSLHLESVLGEGSCYVLSIRPQGGVEMEVE
jgi:hypothetical protein